MLGEVVIPPEGVLGPRAPYHRAPKLPGLDAVHVLDVPRKYLDPPPTVLTLLRIGLLPLFARGGSAGTYVAPLIGLVDLVS